MGLLKTSPTFGMLSFFSATLVQYVSGTVRVNSDNKSSDSLVLPRVDFVPVFRADDGPALLQESRDLELFLYGPAYHDGGGELRPDEDKD